MIARLRARHRRAWWAVAITVLLVLVVAWRERRPRPWMERLPAILQEATP